MTLFSNKNVSFDLDKEGLVMTFHATKDFVHVGLIEGNIGVNLNDQIQVYISSRQKPILQVGKARVSLDKIVAALAHIRSMSSMGPSLTPKTTSTTSCMNTHGQRRRYLSGSDDVQPITESTRAFD